MVRDGVEPPTPAFSGLDSLSLNPFSVNNLIRSSWPHYSDHSVTSADVRLSVGRGALRQIAREADASVGAVQREFENLSKVGLIVRQPVGSQVFYRANRDAPIFREMRALVNKTIGLFSALRSAVGSLSNQIVVSFVYGSVAHEEETAQSDVDLMVVGTTTLDEVLSRLSTVEKSIGRPINLTVHSVAEFKSKLASGNHFLAAVLKGQVFLLGDEDEFRKVGGIRLAKARAD
jgi:predicted nucleotidyltransferase